MKKRSLRARHPSVSLAFSVFLQGSSCTFIMYPTVQHHALSIIITVAHVQHQPRKPSGPNGRTGAVRRTAHRKARHVHAGSGGVRKQVRLKMATDKKISAYPRAHDPAGEDMGANLCPWARARVGCCARRAKLHR
jgi:hypothetical protein